MYMYTVHSICLHNVILVVWMSVRDSSAVNLDDHASKNDVAKVDGGDIQYGIISFIGIHK